MYKHNMAITNETPKMNFAKGLCERIISKMFTLRDNLDRAKRMLQVINVQKQAALISPISTALS